MKQSLEEKIENIFENARYEKDMYDYVGHPYSETDYDLDKVRKGIETLVTEVQREALNTDKVTRVEVIDHTKSFEQGGGRAYVNWKDTNKVELSFQDDERTLKVFISNQQDKQE